MKICFFSIVTYWHGLRGGMENHVKLLLEGLAARGHEITVISTRHPEGIEYEEEGNLRLYYLANTNFGSTRKGWKAESLNRFLALHESDGFDLVCSQQPIFPPIPKKIRNSIPVITLVQAHEAWGILSEINQFLNLRNNLPDLIKKVLSFVYHYSNWEIVNFRKSDLIISPSHEVSSSLRYWYFTRTKKIRTIYNGVDTVRFRPDAEARKRILDYYPQLSGKKVLLFLSHVTRQKGLHLLLKVCPLLLRDEPDIMILVVGGGEYLEEAKEMSHQLGLVDQVIFTGMVDIDSIPDYITAADIFILPTLRKEGLPLSILEVMACKVPVITTNIGGNTSVIKNGLNGILIPPGNTSQLEEAIRSLLNDKEVASKLAEKGYEAILETFSLNKMLNSYERLLEHQVATKS
jgi:glycosyltransferase involved in cell wall biosynthesis